MNDYKQIESSQKQHHEELEHHSRMTFVVEQEELGRFALLKPTITRDGNQWCVLYGDNLQTGIAGFGDTPNKAIANWNAEWNKRVGAGGGE